MNCFQWKQYLTLPARSERDGWLETFWLYLDPTPTTTENERRMEHEARVAAARQLFSIPREPGWDRRGEIYIRFGEPDARTIIDPDVSKWGAPPPREQWYYMRFDMLVSFADITHNGEYFYDEEIPYSIHSLFRSPWSYFFFMLNPFEMLPFIQPDLDSPNEGLAEKIDYCHTQDIEEKRFPACVDITSFKGGPGMLKTEINFEIPMYELELESGNKAEPYEIEFRVFVKGCTNGQCRIHIGLYHLFHTGIEAEALFGPYTRSGPCDPATGILPVRDGSNRPEFR